MDNGFKKYEKIFALDFEMFNAKYYWSICWAGVVSLGVDLCVIRECEMKINPATTHKFIGPDIVFPFTASDLKKEEYFPVFYERELKHFNGALVIGHAVENDIRMILEACHKYGLQPPEFDFIDSNACYNAITGGRNDHSLSGLAETFGIGLDAHNPLSDALCSKEAIRKMFDASDTIESFLFRNGICPGSVFQGVIKRISYPGLTEKTLKRIENYNTIFSAVKRFYGSGKDVADNSRKYCFSSTVSGEFDLSEVTKALYEKGHAVTSCLSLADKVVSAALPLEPDSNRITLRSLAQSLGLDPRPYRLKRFKNKGEVGKTAPAVTEADNGSDSHEMVDSSGTMESQERAESHEVTDSREIVETSKVE